MTGCGRNKGLQLVLDSQRLSTLLPTEFLSKGFKVFVTLPGVSTSKVPFLVDPSFQGEHNFFIHGIHVIKVNLLIYLGFLAGLFGDALQDLHIWVTYKYFIKQYSSSHVFEHTVF